MSTRTRIAGHCRHCIDVCPGPDQRLGWTSYWHQADYLAADIWPDGRCPHCDEGGAR